MASRVRYAPGHLVHEDLYIGDETDCQVGDDTLAVVHGCKDPCHRRAIGYTGNLPSSQPHYLVLERGTDLYMNLYRPIGCGSLCPRK